MREAGVCAGVRFAVRRKCNGVCAMMFGVTARAVKRGDRQVGQRTENGDQGGVRKGRIASSVRINDAETKNLPEGR